MSKVRNYLLVGSIALNCVLGGVIVGHLIRPFNPMHIVHHHVSEITKTLPLDKQKIFTDAEAAVLQRMEKSFDREDQLREDVIGILLEQKLDATKLKSKVDQLESGHAADRKFIFDTVVELMQKMDYEDRLIIVNYLKKHGPPRPSGR